MEKTTISEFEQSCLYERSGFMFWWIYITDICGCCQISFITCAECKQDYDSEQALSPE